jgi:hypothetical protein
MFVLLLLVLLAAEPALVGSSISVVAQGLTVLVVAGIVLWMIISAPFRRRRF